MDYNIKDLLEYLIALVDDFAIRFNITTKEAYRYLKFNKGLQFVNDHYGVIHTIPFNQAVDYVTAYCRKNGGLL